MKPFKPFKTLKPFKPFKPCKPFKPFKPQDHYTCGPILPSIETTKHFAVLLVSAKLQNFQTSQSYPENPELAVFLELPDFPKILNLAI